METTLGAGAPQRTSVQAAERAVVRAKFRSERTRQFTESVIREMTRIAMQYGAVNLAQGFPDFAAPEEIKEAARAAIAADHNQYTVTWGTPQLRAAIAGKYAREYGLELDPNAEITVCCGSTEGMIASLLATTNAGDEVVIFEPFYENYGPDTWLCGATRKLVKLRAPDWTFDPGELRAAFSAKTKAIILTSPHNPTGKVFTRAELEQIAALCREFDTLAITDEIYEHILYDGAEHVPLMTLEGMRERTVLVNSMSKTFSVTGWRVGWVVAAPDLSDSIRKVHDFLTVNSPAPMQQACVMALGLDAAFYGDLSSHYVGRRDLLLGALREAGFDPYVPAGAYYIMAGIGKFGFDDDQRFALHMMEKAGVACVPGSSFFEDPRHGSQLVRFCFCKKYETLKEAGRRLLQLRS
ncbi:MAG: aminotransferase class I/II-fold pyridoxal phosphate-dependent enzyme [Bryobacterales bacterium]|nr:aminotransferase class I/II-fold pyridoxal phosphate-dependent enzyme [Bryobacterales bacterium]